MDATETPYASAVALMWSSVDSVLPLAVYRLMSASAVRALIQSGGSGSTATVQPRNRRKPPRAGSAIALSHAATNGDSSSVCSASASSSAGVRMT